jgi:hypothetical protein
VAPGSRLSRARTGTLCKKGAPRRALGRDTSALPLTRPARANRYPIRRSRHSLFTMSNSPVSSVPARFASGFFSFLFHLRRCRPPSEGIGGAPGDVQPCTCRASNARRHACEAWALPRNREARLTALRRGVVGPGPASVPVAGSGAKAPRPPGTSARLRLPGFSYPRLPAAVDATSRSAFRIASRKRPS